MKRERKKIIEKCEEKLIDLKYRYEHSLAIPVSYQKEGAEIVDMAHREQQIQSSLFFRERMRSILPEIQIALGRIKNGSYGYCELTGEEIEPNRLLAVPWTRVSIKAYNFEKAS